MKWLLIIFFCFATAAYAGCRVVDDVGQSIVLAQPAKHVVVLAPDLTEIVFAIGAGNKIIGVVKGSDYPDAARHLPVVGSYSGLDLERIIAIHPDLIVTWSQAFSRQLSVFKKLGTPIYTTFPRQLTDVSRTMLNLGCLTGTMPTAKQASDHYLRRLAELKSKYEHTQPVTVFYQIGNYSLMTINHDSWINQAISLCGGRNVFAAAKFIAPEVSWEAVVSANPQVIISDVMSPDWKQRWQAFPQITAVKHQQLFAINPDLLSRAGPRLLDGTEQLCEDIAKGRDHN